MPASNLFSDPVDSARAQQSFELLLAELEAVAAGAIVPPWVTALDSARQAWHLSKWASEPARLSRLGALGAEFDPATIGKLNHAGWAMFYIQAKLEDAGASNSAAQIPKELADAGAALDAKLVRMLDYNLGHLPGVAARLASIKAGTGYADTASDLHRLSAIWNEHEVTLAQDGNHYDSSDGARARELAAAILDALSQSQTAEVKRWTDLRARCFTLLARWFDEVRTTCLWLYRNEPEQAAQVIVLSNRTGRTRPKAGDSPSEGDSPAANA